LITGDAVEAVESVRSVETFSQLKEDYQIVKFEKKKVLTN